MNRKAERLLEAFATAPEGVIVEVGAVRFRQEIASDGYSTVHLGRACQESGRRFYSLENSIETTSLANDILQSNGLPKSVVSVDAVWALRGIQNVALLYLDGSDNPDEALSQLLATSFCLGGMVVVDDCHNYLGNRLGKGTRIAEFLENQGVEYKVVDTEPDYKMLIARFDAGDKMRPCGGLKLTPYRINVITCIDNGAGLEQDARLLQGMLTELGHNPSLVHFEKPDEALPADLNIFLEVVNEQMFSFAPRNWCMPNPEWWQWNQLLDRFEWILAKTHDSFARFRILTDRVAYTGFISEDRFIPEIPRERRCLHVAGKSLYKNTFAVLEAWQTYRIQVPLTIVSNYPPELTPKDVTFLSDLSREELIRLQNSHQFHLCPSKYEGWGHYLHEALGVGAVVVTTDSPPMSEFGAPSELRVPPSGFYFESLATMRPVTSAGVAMAVERCLSLSSEQVDLISRKSRNYFLHQRPLFKANLENLIRSRPLA
ncbi:glycosyl transferase group 1 [Pirellula staleyi DSM 6068]|uniref:Glycosyl transferase group 1 n=1 Tax=Pirellula staleyi (strain ATCC 27377 / DSM 6068 / ICPB 4128) TaxID=530564 RepID=D2QZZ9_PIRSD|nr:glycosyltransferase [Pirellula staleyi]ADB18364.1 glycosyl transferase group 1 [Pirellula staleyi DSM 6068]